jgi:predicted nucleic acid-binding protein
MVIVDTTVWIDFFGGVVNSQTSWVRSEAGLTSIGLTDLNLCEVLQGIRDEPTLANVRHILMTFEIFDAGGLSIALEAARNYRLLRQRGYTVRTTIDCLIATFCIESGHLLLHRDRDFDPFERHLGLRVLHP